MSFLNKSHRITREYPCVAHASRGYSGYGPGEPVLFFKELWKKTTSESLWTAKAAYGGVRGQPAKLCQRAVVRQKSLYDPDCWVNK